MIRRGGGFTLIEVLVSVAIIAILSALLFSVTKSVIASSHNARCAANLKQIATSILQFTAEHNGYFPPAHVLPPDPIDGALGERDWYQYLWYSDIIRLKGNGILPNLNSGNSSSIKTVFNCPANPGRIWYWNSPNYAYNYALGENEDRATLGSISMPAKTILAVDAGIRSASPLPPSLGPSDIVCYVTSFSQYFEWKKSVNFNVHHDHANFVMVDGHVESLTRSEVASRADNNTLLWSRDNASLPGGRW